MLVSAQHDLAVAEYAPALVKRAVVGHGRATKADRAKLVNDIRSGMSIGRLGPIVEARLGMKQASDSQIIRLPMPTPRRRD